MSFFQRKKEEKEDECRCVIVVRKVCKINEIFQPAARSGEEKGDPQDGSGKRLSKVWFYCNHLKASEDFNKRVESVAHLKRLASSLVKPQGLGSYYHSDLLF